MQHGSLNNEGLQLNSENDGIIIVDFFSGYRGGVTLDVTGFGLNVINAGHVIIKETATGIFKPMPLNGGATAYASLPADHAYAGILASSIPTAKPFASVMTNGTVNPSAVKFAYTSILSALKTALPQIEFRGDN